MKHIFHDMEHTFHDMKYMFHVKERRKFTRYGLTLNFDSKGTSSQRASARSEATQWAP